MWDSLTWPVKSRLLYILLEENETPKLPNILVEHPFTHPASDTTSTPLDRFYHHQFISTSYSIINRLFIRYTKTSISPISYNNFLRDAAQVFHRPSFGGFHPCQPTPHCPGGSSQQHHDEQRFNWSLVPFGNYCRHHCRGRRSSRHQPSQRLH